MRIAIAGATGLVGLLVRREAERRGHETIPLSRATGVDLTAPDAVAVAADALEGCRVVVDVLSTATQNARTSTGFFTTTTDALLAAEVRAGVAHHLALSIVGIDRAPAAYYAGKVAQEHAIAAGPVPWTILRATQFHEFAAQMFTRAAIGPLHLAPRMRTRPVAAAEVAARLVDLAEQAPIGRATDLGGPREEDLVDMIRRYSRATGHHGWIPAVSLPGDFGAAMRDGRLLPGPDAAVGSLTFANWLAAQASQAIHPTQASGRGA